MRSRILSSFLLFIAALFLQKAVEQINPKNKMVVVFMRNIWPTDHWDYGDRIKSLIYQALK